jgi:hypothetical protein
MRIDAEVRADLSELSLTYLDLDKVVKEITRKLLIPNYDKKDDTANQDNNSRAKRVRFG